MVDIDTRDQSIDGDDASNWRINFLTTNGQT
jgi:hypothetical protein